MKKEIIADAQVDGMTAEVVRQALSKIPAELAAVLRAEYLEEAALPRGSQERVEEALRALYRPQQA